MTNYYVLVGLDTFRNLTISTTCDICSTLVTDVLTHLSNHWLTDLTTENSLNNLNKQVIISALNIIKTEYRLEFEQKVVSILNIGCEATNHSSMVVRFNRKWNPDTLQYLGPIALTKILTDVLIDALNSIQKKVIISMQNTIALEFMTFHIRASKSSLMYVASRIPNKNLYFIEESTNVKAVAVVVNID
jgi:hypothetical protein